MSDFKEVFSKASEFKKQAERILSFSAQTENCPSLKLDRSDEIYLLTVMKLAADGLADVQKRLSYLSRPVVESSHLWKNGSGQYETTRGCCFRAGSPIEVLIPDGLSRWVRTCLKYDGRDYYLEGYPNVPLQGLAVRVRKGDQP